MKNELKPKTYSQIRRMILDIQMLSAIIERDSDDPIAKDTAEMMRNASREIIAEAFPEAVEVKNTMPFKCNLENSEAVSDFLSRLSVKFTAMPLDGDTLFMITASQQEWQELMIFTRVNLGLFD